jgi:hypothetical protein
VVLTQPPTLLLLLTMQLLFLPQQVYVQRVALNAVL